MNADAVSILRENLDVRSNYAKGRDRKALRTLLGMVTGVTYVKHLLDDAGMLVTQRQLAELGIRAGVWMTAPDLKLKHDHVFTEKVRFRFIWRNGSGGYRIEFTGVAYNPVRSALLNLMVGRWLNRWSIRAERNGRVPTVIYLNQQETI